ncbi:hypothetical protein BOTNAR_0159g00060 [Botryotinia narcissicola]|uniref:Uncharacterized protein n=1 Tax=Botryotinia narcissicola TaxID=278944 RepID=A0A4Z1ISG2_9HELO|nr:hypothetical protein BOTNAR_0159g00060 [Botryotinia narcissicola]
MSWKAFIEMLLSDHQEALCKRPGDKIYGLAGLVADTTGFHMEYDKSLIEVWEDLLEVMNRDGVFRVTILFMLEGSLRVC